MNIVILSNRFFSIYNSRQKIIKSLLQQGNKITIIADFDGFERDIKKLDNRKNLSCVNFSFSATSLFFGSIYSLKKEIKKENPDIVHAYNPIPIYAGAFLKLFIEYKLIITITGLGGAYGHNSKAVLLYNYFYKFSIRRSDKVVFQNKDDFEYFSNKLGQTELNKVIVITSSGVDMKRFDEKKTSDSYSGKELFRILFISRLIKQKGIKYLILAAKKLAVHTDIQIHIYGEYDENHNDSISYFEYHELLNLPNITFHGFIKNIEKIYVNHDLLVCCSLREGVPRVILEASASGVPVVAYDVAGVKEGVADGLNGFLVPAFDVSKFKEEIIRLKENQQLYNKISKSSRSFVQTKFSQEAILKKYMEIYNQLIDNS